MNKRPLTLAPTRRILPILLSLALPLALSACGNKGPLVLPDQAQSEAVVEQPTAEQAATEGASSPTDEAPPQTEQTVVDLPAPPPPPPQPPNGGVRH